MYDATQKGLKQGKEEGKEEGIKEGREEGKAEGFKQGKEEGKAEMIKQLVSMKMDVKQIAMVANMSEEEVKKIINEKNK